MPKIKNISPLGELYVPSLNLTVKAGESAEVSAEAAADKAASLLSNAQSTIGE
jgi:hypothetical protein